MLKFFGADVASEGLTASVLSDPDLHGNLVRVPGDISSAAYFIAAALIVPGSEVLLKNVGINPTRDGMLRVCRAMGADITLLNEQNSGGEPVADLLVRYTPSLSGTVIEGELIPTLIDEIPIIAVLAATANGTTVIRNAEELKVKESNRLDIMVNELTAMGVSLEGTDDGMIIEGGKPFHGQPPRPPHCDVVCNRFACRRDTDGNPARRLCGYLVSDILPRSGTAAGIKNV